MIVSVSLDNKKTLIIDGVLQSFYSRFNSSALLSSIGCVVVCSFCSYTYLVQLFPQTFSSRVYKNMSISHFVFIYTPFYKVLYLKCIGTHSFCLPGVTSAVIVVSYTVKSVFAFMFSNDVTCT